MKNLFFGGLYEENADVITFFSVVIITGISAIPIFTAAWIFTILTTHASQIKGRVKHAQAVIGGC